MRIPLIRIVYSLLCRHGSPIERRVSLYPALRSQRVPSAPARRTPGRPTAHSKTFDFILTLHSPAHHGKVHIWGHCQVGSVLRLWPEPRQWATTTVQDGGYPRLQIVHDVP